MRSLLSALSLIVISAGCDSGSSSDGHSNANDRDAAEPMADAGRNAALSKHWLPLEPQQRYAGKSLAEWAVEWMRWSFSQTSCESSNFDPDGSQCRLYQEDSTRPVFFMAYAPSKHARTRCTVPKDHALLVPLANFYADDGGSTKMRTVEQLEATANEVLESMRDLRLRVDDEEIKDLERYIVHPMQYSYDVPAEPNWYSCNGYDGVASTVIAPAVVSGYFALLPPPELGPHVLEYGGVMTFNHEDYSLQMTNQFEVLNE